MVEICTALSLENMVFIPIYDFDLRTEGWQNMPKMTKNDLIYKDYSWKAVEGDDPTKTAEDADRFSRREGYEVIYLLNTLSGTDNADLSIRTRQICEWMIHEKLPSNIQGRSKVITWIVANFAELSKIYPF